MSQQEANRSIYRALSELDEELIELAIEAMCVDHGKSEMVLETMRLTLQAAIDGKGGDQILADIRRIWRKNNKSTE